MNNKPLITVVIPTFNRAAKTIAAIEGVLAQTYPHWEIIVVNDGSTDGSSEVLERYLSQRENAGRQAQQIRYFNQRNQGASAARNTGIENARGEYIAFLDSDDVWFPEKLDWQLRAIEQFKDDCGAFFTDSKVAEYSRTYGALGHLGINYKQQMGIEKDATRLLAKGFCGFWMSTLLVRTDLIKQIGGFDTNISYCEDRDLYFRLSQVTSIAYVNKELARIDRISEPNDSEVRPWIETEVQLRMSQKMLEKWFTADAILSPEVHTVVVRGLRDTHSRWANWYLETERYDEARQAVSRAMTYEFTIGLLGKRILAWIAPVLARRIAPKAKPYLA